MCILNLAFPVLGRSIRLGVCFVRLKAFAGEVARSVRALLLPEAEPSSPGPQQRAGSNFA